MTKGLGWRHDTGFRLETLGARLKAHLSWKSMITINAYGNQHTANAKKIIKRLRASFIEAAFVLVMSVDVPATALLLE